MLVKYVFNIYFSSQIVVKLYFLFNDTIFNTFNIVQSTFVTIRIFRIVFLLAILNVLIIKYKCSDNKKSNLKVIFNILDKEALLSCYLFYQDEICFILYLKVFINLIISLAYPI